ncbi:uncharacterized protein KGF55_000028 [Candida pseudojiufengensis]|uniref:uncharacterized protein n=1 Tax=Candida pseudojiufengensis TaxID=497109 RepID=UPI002225919C|nr:uncharacterized protein KGF55_000028 [Candida pseudojiufengensis]KAI5968044.1 hypothetical protein KGF55_000028 [Candida pseudojiufengensis]
MFKNFKKKVNIKPVKNLFNGKNKGKTADKDENCNNIYYKNCNPYLECDLYEPSPIRNVINDVNYNHNESIKFEETKSNNNNIDNDDEFEEIELTTKVPSNSLGFKKQTLKLFKNLSKDISAKSTKLFRIKKDDKNKKIINNDLIGSDDEDEDDTIDNLINNINKAFKSMGCEESLELLYVGSDNEDEDEDACEEFVHENIVVQDDEFSNYYNSMDNKYNISKDDHNKYKSESDKKDKDETLVVMNHEGTFSANSENAKFKAVENSKSKPVETLKLKPMVELKQKIFDEEENEIIEESSKDFLRKEKACIKKTATDWWENNEIDSPLTLDDLTKVKRWGKSNDRNLDWREISLVQTQEVLVEEELLPKKPIQKLNNYLDFRKRLDIPLCIKPMKWQPILETIYEEVEEPQNENYNSENTSINLEDRIKESFNNLFKGKNTNIFNEEKCQQYYEEFAHLCKKIVTILEEDQEEEDLSSCYNETDKEDENYLTDDEKSNEDYQSNFEEDESLLLSEEEYSDSERETFLFQPVENDIIKGIVMKCLDDEMNLAELTEIDDKKDDEEELNLFYELEFEKVLFEEDDEDDIIKGIVMKYLDEETEHSFLMVKGRSSFDNMVDDDDNKYDEDLKLFIKLETEKVSLDESSSSDEDEQSGCCGENVLLEEGDEDDENIKSADSLQVKSVVYKPGDEIIRKIIQNELLENMEDLMNFKTPVNFGK